MNPHTTSNAASTKPAMTWNACGATIDGPLDGHTVSLVLSGGDVTVDLNSTGTLRNGVLAETIGTGTVTVPGEQRWKLREPATVRLALERVNQVELVIGGGPWQQDATRNPSYAPNIYVMREGRLVNRKLGTDHD